MQAAAQPISRPGVHIEVVGSHASYPSTGVLLITGAVLATVFNLLFPRAADPTDTVAVLTMMTEHETRRQVSFLGITAAIWLLTAGVLGISRSVAGSPGAALARFGFFGALIGAALLTAANGLGMVATTAAVEWAAAGAETTSAEYAIAATLNHADDGVWFMSIIVFWGALGVLGFGMLRSGDFPRWSAIAIIILGLANALLVGVPLADGVVNQTMFLLFGGIAQLTIVWALATGIWMTRQREATDE